jgi:hypothetical protein
MGKQKLLAEFDEIELDIQDLNSEDCSGDLILKKVAVVMGKLSHFAKSASGFADAVISAEGPKDELGNKRTKAALSELVTQVYSLMQLLSSPGFQDVSGRAECLSEAKGISGKIALLIRFEFKAVPVLVGEGADMNDAYQALRNISDSNKDYFTVSYFYQNSVWKYLPRYEFNDVAIVMQGAVVYENDFTLESLYRYRRTYPNVMIIVSTWNGTVEESFRWKAESIGVIIVEKEKPSDGGTTNIKLQLKSSYNGICEAEKNPEIRYVLKTRTDQRLFLPDFLSCLKNMEKTYKVASPKLKERVIFMGGYQTSCTCPFEMCDFMSFGAIEDIKGLYSSDGVSDKLILNGMSVPDYYESRALTLYERSHEDDFYGMMSLSKDERIELSHKLMKYLDAETYIVLSFYERCILGRPLNENDDWHLHYWHFLKDCAIIINSEYLHLYWFKYENRYWTENSLISMGSLTFSVWLDILYSDIPEIME